MTVTTLAAVASLAIAGCQSAPAPKYSANVSAVTNFDDLLRPAVAVTGFGGQVVANRAQGVSPGSPIKVTSSNGQLTDVTLTGDDGAVDGSLAPDGRSWTSKGTFGFGENYTLVADARGVTGVAASKISFTTASPSQLTHAYVVPADGETVGVGQPVAVQFDETISDRAAAQKAITVTTNPPVEGAFYWISDTEVRWRPEHYWMPGTKVHVAVNTKAIDLGKGTFGENNVTTDFTIGRAMISYADDATKMINVTVNGQTVRTMPTSMGKDSTPTNTGIYIVAERLPSVIMDSSTYGVPVNSPQGYRETVYSATRISYSGIYVHSAPWSLGDQGNTDVSNGCLNVSPDNAKWFLDNSLRGDIVEVKDTVGPPLPGNDGLGDWNVPWAQWKQGNA